MSLRGTDVTEIVADRAVGVAVLDARLAPSQGLRGAPVAASIPRTRVCLRWGEARVGRIFWKPTRREPSLALPLHGHKAATGAELCRYLLVDIRSKIPDAKEEKAPRYTRRLSDHILVAFHLACDQGSFEVAEQLLKVLETVISYPRLPQGSHLNPPLLIQHATGRDVGAATAVHTQQLRFFARAAR